MNEHQYQRLLRNRRRAPLVPLFSGGANDRTLRELARDLRRRERVERALETVMPAAWLAAVRVDAVEGDLVVLRIANAVVAEQVRRIARGLGRDLGKQVPGITRVVALPSGYGGEGIEDGEP